MEVRWLMQETGCDEVVARIALEHARGNVFVARDLLLDEVCASRFAREAEEYDR